MKNKLMRVFLLLALAPMLFVSCEQEEGPGGTSSIVGRVWVVDYNSNFTRINGEYWGEDERVFLMYGNDTIYSKKFDTDYAGCYRFDYLTKGDYTLYVLSKDSANPSSTQKVPVFQKVKITKNNQEVKVPTIKIFD